MLWLRPTPSQRAELPAEKTRSEQRRECRTPHDRRHHEAVTHVHVARPDNQNPNRSATYQRQLQINGNRILRTAAHGTCCTLHKRDRPLEIWAPVNTPVTDSRDEASSTRLAVLTVCVEEPVSRGLEHWHCCQSARGKIPKVTFKLIPSLYRSAAGRERKQPGSPPKKENAPDSDLSWGVRSSSPPPKATHNHQKSTQR